MPDELSVPAPQNESIAPPSSLESPAPPPPKKRIRRRAPSRAKTHQSDKEIEKKLSAIYKDGAGKLPPMNKIKMKKRHSFFGLIVTVLIVGGLLSAAAWAGFIYLPIGSDKFSESQVALTIDGPRTLTLGATSTYTITFSNKQKIALKNARLNINYPEGFIFALSSEPSSNAGHTEWNLGSFSSGEEKTITITGLSYGSLNKQTSWRVFFDYQPANLNSGLQKVATLNTKITESPLSLSVSGPDKVITGNEAAYIFTISNTEKEWPEKLELIPRLPANFFITSSTPSLDKNNKWNISRLSASSSATLAFKVTGKFSEADETSVPVGAGLYLPVNGRDFEIAGASLNSELSKNSLGLNLIINGTLKNFSTQPGDTLNITLNLKNNSPSDLNRAIVKLTLDAPAYKKQSILNFLELTDKADGWVTGETLSDTRRRGQITWTSKNIPALLKLKPGEEINIDLRLPIKDAKNFDLSAYKESQIAASAEVEYYGQSKIKNTLAGNVVVITLNSDLKFETRDTVSASPDGKEVHAITWVLSNSFHPLKSMRLSADVYGDVTLEEPKTVPAGEFKYDPTEKKITWIILEMPENTDVLAVPFTVTLNQKNPTQQTLISKVHIQGEDTVSGESLDLLGDETFLIPPAN